MLLTVLAPLGLLVWAGLSGRTALFRKLVTYWRISALLMVSVYLLAGAVPIAFLAGVAARVFIPLSLGWPFSDAEDLGRVFHLWRQVVGVYCLVGVLFNLPLLWCTFTWRITPPCAVWVEAVQEVMGRVHPGVGVEVLGTVGWVGLGVYVGTAGFLYSVRYRRRRT